MSSMLKKTGGLSFKPKAGRRPGASSSKPPTSSNSVPSTRAPTTEPQSQASTPAASNASDASTPAIVASIEITVQEPSEPPILTHPLPGPAGLQTPSASDSQTATTPVQPSSEPAASISPAPPPLPVAQNPTPQPSTEALRDSAPHPEPYRPAAGVSTHDAQPAPVVDREDHPFETTDTSSRPSVTTTTTPSALSDPGEEGASVPPAATASPSSPPVSEPAIATSQPVDAVEHQPPAPAKQAPRRRKAAVTDSSANTEGPAPKRKRQSRKPSTRATTEGSEGANSDALKPTRRRKREPTPENAEELTVDHSTMTVGELTKDLGIGKRFRHAEEIEQRAREARAKYKLKKLERDKRKFGLLPPDDEDSASHPDTSNASGETRGAAMAQLGASMEAGAGQGVGYDVVDGQIVVHAASLVVNRHNQDMSALEEVEENDFTNLVNSASFAKRVQAPGNWTDEETDKFYRLLGMFGTDFETISRLFPGKNRRAIKLKFNKEERLRPNRVNAAMMVRGQKKVNIDIEEYKASQRQWQAKDTILEEHARLAQEHEREVARLREERRAQGLIDDDDEDAAKKNTNADGSGVQRDEGGFEVIEEDADALGQGAQGVDMDMGVDVEAQPEALMA
ncbi:hypothetical protein F4802DRAFT_590558 [Xylaria palmicola]|nr:hypothetical protein F4802DRAFT_590558 [Xylaria palmicola]